MSDLFSYSFNTFTVKEQVIKNGIVYGSNGYGKTNLDLAIFDIVCHLSYKWVKWITIEITCMQVVNLKL